MWFNLFLISQLARLINFSLRISRHEFSCFILFSTKLFKYYFCLIMCLCWNFEQDCRADYQTHTGLTLNEGLSELQEIILYYIFFPQVLNSGWLNRRVASTSMNRESSRSHAVFTVALESKVGEFNINYTCNPTRLGLGGLTFSLVNAPTQVNFLLFS